MSRPVIDYPPSVSPTVKDIAFSAGFYEGEGSISLSEKVEIQIQIIQNDREILDKLQSHFGGKVYGPYQGSSGNEYYNLRLVRERAIGFSLTIFTFLSKNRRKQIKEILEGKEGKREYKEFDKEKRKIDKFFSDILKNKT